MNSYYRAVPSRPSQVAGGRSIIIIFLITAFILGIFKQNDKKEELIRENKKLEERQAVFNAQLSRTHTVERIRNYLNSKNSPLGPYADFMVSMGDKYNLDPRIFVAISGRESTFGINAHSFNATGLGGTKFIHFDSWEDSIEYTFKLLTTSHYYRTFQKTGSLYDLARVYCTTETPEKYSSFLQNVIDSI